MSRLFDDSFRRVLRDVVARSRRVRGRQEEGERARRRVLSNSGTFAGHRRYEVGDDLRRVDWNAYARSRELFVKTLEEEQRRALTILLDTSASMVAGSPPRFDAARRFAALLGAVALVRLDGVHLCTSDEVFSLQGAVGIERLLDRLDALEPGGPADAGLVQLPFQRRLRGRLVWLSDFADLDETAHGLRVLGTRRRDAVGFLPRLAEDERPRLDGWLELHDPEDGSKLRVNIDEPLRGAMSRELKILDRRRADAFLKVGIPLLRVPVPALDDTRASAWLGGGWLDRV